MDLRGLSCLFRYQSYMENTKDCQKTAGICWVLSHSTAKTLVRVQRGIHTNLEGGGLANAIDAANQSICQLLVTSLVRNQWLVFSGNRTENIWGLAVWSLEIIIVIWLEYYLFVRVIGIVATLGDRSCGPLWQINSTDLLPKENLDNKTIFRNTYSWKTGVYYIYT